MFEGKFVVLTNELCSLSNVRISCTTSCFLRKSISSTSASCRVGVIFNRFNRN